MTQNTFEYMTPGMSLDQVIAYCKKYPEKVSGTDLGQAVLKAIKRGDTKWLKRYWKGKR